MLTSNHVKLRRRKSRNAIGALVISGLSALVLQGCGNAPVQGESAANPAAQSIAPKTYSFTRVGQAEMADGTVDTLGYSKLSPWPYSDGTMIYTGCYEPVPLKESAWSDRCFATIDISDPETPRRLATVPGYDPIKSPAPPKGHIIWSADYSHPNLPVKFPCLVDWDAPDIASGKTAPDCWDPGWNTHTHFVARGPNGLLAVNQEIYRDGTDRQENFRGVKFYDVSDPAAPVYLSYWEAPASPADPVTGQYPDMHGVHHFNFDGDHLMLGGEYEGYVGKIFVILDLSDPKNPTEVSKWALPGQKTPEEDHLRDWTQVPKFNSPVIQLEDGTWRKHVGMHYVSMKNDIAYLSYHQKGLVILDVANKAEPKLLSHLDYITPEAQVNSPDRAECIASGGGVPTACGNAHSAKLLPHNDNVLIMTDEYFSCPFGHMRLFDVSDPSAPKTLSHFLIDENTQCSESQPDKTANTGRYPHRGPSTHMANVFENISNDTLFVAWYGAGVRAVDVSDLSAPKELAAYTYSIADDFPDADPAIIPKLTGQDTYDVIQGPTGHIYVSDGSTGLRVLEFNED